MVNLRIVPLLSGIAAALVMLGLGWQIREQTAEEDHATKRLYAADKLSLVAATLSQTINVRLTHTRSLAAFVETVPDFEQSDFEKFTAVLQDDLEGLRSLQLEPNGIVTFVTDLERNRAALGYDLFADPESRALVERSIRDREQVFSGPLNLVQGGQAIIARRPIFNPDDSFWGFATALIDVEPLLREAGYLQLAKELRLAIRGKDGLGAGGEVFHGEASVFEDPVATARVALPVGSWQIGAAELHEHGHDGFVSSASFIAITAGLAILLGGAVYTIVDRPGRLRVEVKRATAELIEARDQAEAANRAKTEFVSVVSHELRTPLTAIRGSLDLLQSGTVGELDEKTKEIVRLGARNSRRLVALINDILDMNSILAGELEFKSETVPLVDLLNDTVAINQPYADSLNARLEIKPVDDPAVANAVIPCDRERIRHVLTNLITNACKFSPADGVVTLSAEPALGGSAVAISVTDRGPGIAEIFRPHIFEQFTQADSSDTRQTGGTGLGLYISKLIMDRHGGHIDFETEIGKGTTFRIELPL